MEPPAPAALQTSPLAPRLHAAVDSEKGGWRRSEQSRWEEWALARKKCGMVQLRGLRLCFGLWFVGIWPPTAIIAHPAQRACPPRYKPSPVANPIPKFPKFLSRRRRRRRCRRRRPPKESKDTLMAEQQHRQQGRPARLPAPAQLLLQGPPAPLPAPVPREITQNDYHLAFQTVKRRGFPIPGNAPDVVGVPNPSALDTSLSFVSVLDALHTGRGA